MASEPRSMDLPLPNWPILLSTALAARYLSLDEHTFGIVAAQGGVQAVDIGLPLVRWRRSELDRLVNRLPAKLPEANQSRPGPDPSQAELMVEKIVQGVAARMAFRPAEPPAHAMSLKDAAKTVGVSRSTLYRLVSEGQLPTVRVGSRVLVKRADLEALLDGPPQPRRRGRPKGT